MRNVCPCDVSHEETRKLLFGTSWELRDMKHVAYYYLCFEDYVLVGLFACLRSQIIDNGF